LASGRNQTLRDSRVTSAYTRSIRGIQAVIKGYTISMPWMRLYSGISASVERISEAYLIPVLGSMLFQFPFVIHGFHSDNGSEFVNHVVARLLNKLLICFTKSRPRHTNDNGLVETKNSSVVRKNLGYSYIPLVFIC